MFLFSRATILAFVGCSAPDPVPAEPDSDAVIDTDSGAPAEPTPESWGPNKANLTVSGGHALVVGATAYDADNQPRPDLVFDPDLKPDCFELWSPQGSLCDQAPTTDDPTRSTRLNNSVGATFRDAAQGATGLLLIDLCADGSCASVDLDRAVVFQMFSDGKTTQLRLAAHTDDATVPAWDDAGWRTISRGARGFVDIGPGVTVGDGLQVSEPTVLPLDATNTRFVRVEVRNDGTYGDADYTELRSLKLFGP